MRFPNFEVTLQYNKAKTSNEANLDIRPIIDSYHFSSMLQSAKEVIGPFKKHIDIFFNEIDEPFRLTVYGENINNYKTK